MAKPTPKKRPAWLWHAAALTLALGAGILIGRSTGPALPATGTAGAAARTAALSRAGASGTRMTRDHPQAQTRERATGENHPATADTTLATILESTSRLDRTQRLISFLDRLPTEQFAAVYQEFRDSPLADLRGSERSLVLQAWAERDPLNALAFLQQQGAQDWERETTVATWAANDPQSAYAWANSAADEGNVNNWMLGALRGIASTNPELARDFLAQMDNNATRGRALQSIQPFIMQHGFDSATRWISEFQDNDLRSAATRMLADDLVALDPARAAAWNAALADTNTRRDVSETIADRWAGTDLTSARAWVESLPEDTRTEAAEGVARHYARQDPVQAARWLTSLGNNPDLDGARRVFIEESFRSDPATSLGFVSQLSDTRAREGYYHRLVNGWIHSDATAARTWVTQNAAALPQGVVNHALR